MLQGRREDVQHRLQARGDRVWLREHHEKIYCRAGQSVGTHEGFAVTSCPGEDIYFIQQRIDVARKELELVSQKIEEEVRVEFGRKDRLRRRGW